MNDFDDDYNGRAVEGDRQEEIERQEVREFIDTLYSNSSTFAKSRSADEFVRNFHRGITTLKMDGILITDSDLRDWFDWKVK